MISRYKRSMIIIAVILVFSLLFGCANNRERRIEEERDEPDKQQEEEVKKPPIPEQLKDDRTVVVYVLDEGAKKEIEIEEYISGVLGGEMHNDWPEEALRAQAILARTFVMNFLVNKTSKYEGADVSTDIEEAQAWNQEAVNERVKKAVADTSGMVAVHGGKYINAWFHSHAGEKTATAAEGLAYKDEEPPYIQSVESPDSKDAPKEDAQWSVEFTKQEIIQAASKMGKELKSVNKMQVGEKGPSDRALNISIDGTALSAPELRIALDSTKMKSTRLTDIQVEGDKVTIKGKGYGHGVGMSQWGAYAMAKDGKKAKEIIQHYFKDIAIVNLWE